MNWTSEQILSLAPDASSAKAGQSLAAARHWQSMGGDDNAVWGLCQGSGKNPYQTQIDLSEPAFKCSCPSRKFPCKHSLGLFLLFIYQRQAFTESAPPAWVNEWLASRTKRAEQKTEKQQAREKPIDEAAQGRRATARETKVAVGVQELGLWLRDLIRNGLAAVQTQPPQYWERMAARLVDAQAPGLARLVRELRSAANIGDGWQSCLLERAGKLHLLLEGYKRIQELPEENQDDIRALIGWTINQEDLLNQSGVRDKWLVIGQRVEQEERLRVQRIWLWGERSNRAALILHFAHGQQPLDASLVIGTTFNAELVFFPGAISFRALIKDRQAAAAHFDFWPGIDCVKNAFESYAAAVARMPWLEIFPLSLTGVVPMLQNDNWFLRDAEGRALPLHTRFAHGWELLALSGGRPLTVFGEWDGRFLWPLSLLAEGRLVKL